MYPVLSKELSEAHYKEKVGVATMIDFDAKRISAGENERISGEFRWVCSVADEAAPLGDCAVIDFKCGLPIRVLISEIDLTELKSSLGTRV